MIELLVILIGGAALAIVCYSVKYGITPTPTSPKVKKMLLKILPRVINGEVVDLGSGWGTLAFALAKKYPSCKIVGIEISPIPYFCSLLLARVFRYPNLVFLRRDFFDYRLQETSLVVCYLYPDAMEWLKIKFENELLPSTYVVSHTFAVPGWKPLRTLHAPDLYRTPIYLYQK